jgi:hypothetical protein
LIAAALGCSAVALLREHTDVKQIHVSFDVSQESRARARQPAVVPKIAAAACYPIVMIELIFILPHICRDCCFYQKRAVASRARFPANSRLALPAGKTSSLPGTPQTAIELT